MFYDKQHFLSSKFTSRIKCWEINELLRSRTFILFENNSLDKYFHIYILVYDNKEI